MRDWNPPKRTRGKSRVTAVFSIPMRDWNTGCQRAYINKHSVFSIPMRDWNVSAKALVNEQDFRFQHTYEGLKPFSSLAGDPSNCCVFSIPMRDWNPWKGCTTLAEPIVFSIPMRDWNFTCIFQRLLNNFVFSIPMRDWNLSKTGIKRQGKNGFQHTYEGLKQYKIYERSASKSKFSAYLWGIETLPVSSIRKQSLHVFSIPMRDWN